MKVILGCRTRRPPRKRAGRAWRQGVTNMVAAYAHAVNERRLDENDWAFERDANRDRNTRLITLFAGV